MGTRARPTRFLRPVVLALTLAAASPSPLVAAETPVLRIFLRDGTTLSSYGEYARVNGRLVFSLPLGVDHGEPRLQVVTLDAAKVDWERTDRYRDSVRASQYAATRGEGDFTVMTGEVARVLNDIALTADPARRLALAEQARRKLNDWPGQHYGYRAREVREIAGLLDEAVSELRAAAGQQAFDLNLVAMADAPAAEKLLPAPTPSETIAQALSLADDTDVPAERIDLLRATLDFIDRSRGAVPEASRLAARAFAQRRLDKELAADRAYSALAQAATARAGQRAARADVRGVEHVIKSVERRDAAMGHQRPDDVRSLIGALQDQLNAARRLRLARDQWKLRASAYRSYMTLVQGPLAQLDEMKPGLQDIKRLAGPDATELTRMRDLSARSARVLHSIVPPTELAGVHSLLQSACDMGGSAAQIRLQAVVSGDMRTAWNASAAASGALMFLTQARTELSQFLAPPVLR